MHKSTPLNTQPTSSSAPCKNPNHLTPAIRNNREKTYRRIYHELGLARLPSPESFAQSLAGIFENILQSNASQSAPHSPYNSRHVPRIGLEEYFCRMARYSLCSFETLVLAVIYIDRLHGKCADQFLNQFNVHK